MSERIAVHILPEHFEAFKKLMPNDERFGNTYHEWIMRRVQEARSSSVAAKQVTVTPREFELYCLQLGQVPNYSVLQMLATNKARY